MLERSDTPVADYMQALRAQYERMRKAKFKLDMTRGKPCASQIALSLDMLRSIATHTPSGIDCLNYGHPDGIPEARRLCARYLGTDWKQTLVLGNSSLELMYKVIAEHRMRRDWPKNPKFICPVPGYDRHHTICDKLDIVMISVPMNETGPVMDRVRELVQDPDVVGMWCMPKYSNPTGKTWTKEVCQEIANLKPVHRPFMFMWDNAYAEHHLTALRHPTVDILKLAREAGTEDEFWIFGSFSKVTFASAGLAMMSGSPSGIDWFRKRLAAQTIGPDKLTQLRHVRFLKNMDGIRRLMRRHRKIILPKFNAVYTELERTIGGKGIATWTKPDGGYFILLKMQLGSAKRVVELAKAIGVQLTPAGAPFPRGNDPEDAYIRIAPTYPELDEVKTAARVLGVCAELAHREAHPQTMRR